MLRLALFADLERIHIAAVEVTPGCHWMLVKLPMRESTRLKSSGWNQAALNEQMPPEELPAMARL